MTRALRTSLAGLLLALAGPGNAQAQAPAPAPARAPAPAPPPAPAPAPPPTDAASPAPAPAPAPADADPSTSAEVDAELRRMAEEQASDEGSGEVVEIFEARPKPPIERGVEVRLTYEQLVARGATDLASALRLLPDVSVRDAGRGGFNIDVRGGRKGAVIVLIDGIQVSDPYYGTFDVSTIPITDIVQIRMSPNPATPLDGPGGPSGMIEVLTRDAIGKQLVIARLVGDSLSTFGATGMARVALAKHLALRLSMSGDASSRDLPVVGGRTLDEERHTATGSTRLEYRRGKRRVVLDGFLDSRHYISPPSDSDRSEVVMIDRELSARASVKGDDERGDLQLQGQGYAHYLARRSRHFSDPTLESESSLEDLHATRIGGAAVVAHPLGRRGRWIASVIGSHERARVVDESSDGEPEVTRGNVTTLEAAGGIKYETTRWQLDGAAGLAVPFGVDATPWPEARLVAKYQPRKNLELAATGGHKGRVPTLRERFDPQTRNTELEPEKSWLAELRATYRLDERVRVEVAPFYRRTNGIIRLIEVTPPDAPPGTQREYMRANLDLTWFFGVDSQVRVKPHRLFEVGGSYNYIRARSDDPNLSNPSEPLDRLPHHRLDGWVQVTPDPRISVLARVKYFGESVDKTATVPGYATLEATVTAPITKQYLGVLRIDDVTDVRPETRKNYHTAGRVISLIIQGSWE